MGLVFTLPQFPYGRNLVFQRRLWSAWRAEIAWHSGNPCPTMFKTVYKLDIRQAGGRLFAFLRRISHAWRQAIPPCNRATRGTAAGHTFSVEKDVIFSFWGRLHSPLTVNKLCLLEDASLTALILALLLLSAPSGWSSAL